jgi:hypothetical protein
VFQVTPEFQDQFEDDEPPVPVDLVVLQLQSSQRSVQDVLKAQAAAENAQQELLAEPSVAAAIASGNELISSILSTFQTVQQLYHKAVVPLLQRHPQYIDCPAGASLICRIVLLSHLHFSLCVLWACLMLACTRQEEFT